MKANSVLRWLPRRKKGLGIGFSDMVGLAHKSKAFKGHDDTSWQEAFVPRHFNDDGHKKISPWVSVGLGFAAAVALFLFVGRLWQLQVVLGQDHLQASEGNRVRIRLIPAPRGVIYDRQGVILASNSPGFRLVAESVGVKTERLQEIANFSATLTDQSPAEVIDKLTDASLNEAVISSGLTRDEALNFELKLKDFPELRIVEEPIRSYPQGKTLAHLIGYLGEINEGELTDSKYASLSPGDKIGRAGIEATYDYLLRGQDGRELVEVDSLGRTERIVAREEPVAGRNIVLTVDLALTKTLEGELIKQINAAGSKKGAVVALNPQDGSVLAYISYPSFDPNLFSRGISVSDYNKLISDSNQPLFDRVISGVYPPGSTFKPLVSVAALSEKVTTKDRLINSPGVVYLGTQAFRNWRPSGFGLQNIIDSIAYSNDIYFYYMGAELGVDRLTPWAKKFGLGEPTGIKIPGEAEGTVPTSEWKKEEIGEIWYPGDNYNYGIGQGYLLVSPIQLVSTTAAISNGGYLYQPILLKEVRDSSNLVVSRDNPVLKRGDLANSDVITITKEGMRKACALFVNLAGDTGCKTGSAEFGGADQKSHAWFVTFAPWEKPEIAIAVLIEGGGNGSTVSSPVTRPVLEKYLKK